MQKELDALESNGTWQLIVLLKGKKTIRSKWVYRVKFLADGSVDRFKARLVAKGYNQVPGLNFTKSFSPVAKTVTVRVFLAFAAAKTWPIHQIDVNNAYLHGTIDEDLYMYPPKGYNKTLTGQVCKLIKFLYRLKQSGRQWNKELSSKLFFFGFTQSQNDTCLFTKLANGKLTMLLVYVDDLVISAPDVDSITEMKNFLHAAFTIKVMGHARYFLGVKLARSEKGLFLHQIKYTLDILKDAGLLEAKPNEYPMIKNLKLDADTGFYTS